MANIMELSNIETWTEELIKATEHGSTLFEKQIKEYEISGYHYTKLYNINDIKENGLLSLCEKSVEIIKCNIKKEYKKDSKYIEEQFKKYIEEQLKKYTENQYKYISFHTNKNQSTVSLNEILRYYGGENIVHYFQKNNNIRKKLLTMGTPSIIKFYFKYDNLSEGSKNTIRKLINSIGNKDTQELLEKIELRIKDKIIIDKIQGYYILDKNDFKIKKFINIK